MGKGGGGLAEGDGMASLEEEIAGREVTRHRRPIECTYLHTIDGGRKLERP